MRSAKEISLHLASLHNILHFNVTQTLELVIMLDLQKHVHLVSLVNDSQYCFALHNIIHYRVQVLFSDNT